MPDVEIIDSVNLNQIFFVLLEENGINLRDQNNTLSLEQVRKTLDMMDNKFDSFFINFSPDKINEKVFKDQIRQNYLVFNKNQMKESPMGI